MDQNLDKLAASDGKADAARDRLTTQGNNGTISQEEASKGIAADQRETDRDGTCRSEVVTSFDRTGSPSGFNRPDNGHQKRKGN
jgi:hypothetical protein